MQEKRIFTSLLRRIFAAFKENRDLLDKCLGRSRPFIHSEMATFLHFKTDKVLIFPIIFFILSNFSYNTNFHALRVCNSIQRHSFYKFYTNFTTDYCLLIRLLVVVYVLLSTILPEALLDSSGGFEDCVARRIGCFFSFFWFRASLGGGDF